MHMPITGKESAVVADSHLWIDLFRGKRTPFTAAMDELLEIDRVWMVGPIFYEVLIGSQKKGQRQYIFGQLRKLQFFETTFGVWYHATKLGVLPGVIIRKVPAFDVLIAAHCEVYKCSLLTRDPHY